ncbi:hypothetical protein [Nocardia brasiliensis]|uniref:hypothetical protein n=1 Tax=Nocardia brasiliensis TaxID=37326 RepID=UPI0002F8E328|nr:hypothetical protein [Nocardia brasiliensis]SUB48112.1 Uncharacterised protein [Nocardia brasiliensis]
MSNICVAMGFAVLAATGIAIGAGPAQAAPQSQTYPGLTSSECRKLTDDARRAGATSAICYPDKGDKKKAVVTYR